MLWDYPIDGFWKHAVRTAVHVYNVTPISKANFLTPKEMWSGSKPDISHLRIFRCAAYVHILKGKRQKLNLKSREMIFVGYENLSKGWQFWDAKNQRIEISCDVKFDESQFPLRKDLDQRNPSTVEKRWLISEANQVQVEICDKSQWLLQGKTCCERLYPGTRNRLQRNLFSSIEI